MSSKGNATTDKCETPARVQALFLLLAFVILIFAISVKTDQDQQLNKTQYGRIQDIPRDDAVYVDDDVWANEPDGHGDFLVF